MAVPFQAVIDTDDSLEFSLQTSEPRSWQPMTTMARPRGLRRVAKRAPRDRGPHNGKKKCPIALSFVNCKHDSLARQAVIEYWSRQSDPHCCLFLLAKLTSNVEWLLPPNNLALPGPVGQKR